MPHASPTASPTLLHAAQAFRSALATHPTSLHALLGLTLIARRIHQPTAAFRLAQAALTAHPNAPQAWAGCGDCLFALGRHALAAAAFHRALALDPNLPAAHFGIGNLHALQENFSAALVSFASVLKSLPRCPEAHFAIAFVHGKLGRRPQAIAAYARAIQLQPAFASAWLNLGVELIADGRSPLAFHCYTQAIRLTLQQPGNAHSLSTQISACINLGHLERSRRNYPQANRHYLRALALSLHLPARLSETHIALAYLHLDRQQFAEAEQSLNAAHASNPANADIPNARGILLLGQKPTRLAAAEQALQEFLQAEHLGHRTAASNRGNALLRLGRCEEALAAHQQAVDRDPHHPGARYNLALTQLRLGNFTDGWRNYESRWQFRDVHPRPRRFTQPLWPGETIPTTPPSTLLLYAEQGLGDTLQFFRFLPGVAQRLLASNPTAHILVEVQPSLVRLLTPAIQSLQQLPGITAEVLTQGSELPPFTHHCPLMSLPAVFATTLHSIPNSLPYLHADPGLSAQRASELKTSPPRIGISWAGNPNYRADHERSTQLSTFLPLLKLPNIQWVSLQKGPAANQIPDLQQLLPTQSLYDGSSQDTDFAQTAALLANLDLVIATDTAIAHLAGAMNKPLWLLLPWQSDWRWMQSIETTPWYPQAKLLRQSTPNNWPELIDRVHLNLKQRLASQKCKCEVRSVECEV
jgi:tetratricopeptide (TPR) repeat protein